MGDGVLYKCTLYLIVEIFAYLGLLWYFEHICVGTKKSLFFCLKPSYW